MSVQHFLKTSDEPIILRNGFGNFRYQRTFNDNPRTCTCLFIGFFIALLTFIVCYGPNYYYENILSSLNTNNNCTSLIINSKYITNDTKTLQYYQNNLKIFGRYSTIYERIGNISNIIFYTKWSPIMGLNYIHLYSYQNNTYIGSIMRIKPTFIGLDKYQIIVNDTIIGSIKQAFWRSWTYSNQYFNVYKGNEINSDNIVYNINGYWYDRTYNITKSNDNNIVSQTFGAFWQWSFHYNYIINKNNDIALITLINIAVDLTNDTNNININYIISYIIPIIIIIYNVFI